MTDVPNLPQRFDDNTLKQLKSVLDTNVLFYINYWNENPSFVDRAILDLKAHLSVNHIATTSSGTASIHAALASLKIPAGKEVVIPPITDVGGFTPVIFQNLIPVFADVDPDSGMITADTIADVMTERTAAVVVMHHSGTPAEMDPIVKLCKDQSVPLIEDTAQALGATYKGKACGTIGDIGAFSLNHWKHVAAGEGGFIATDNIAYFEEAHHFADKYWDRLERALERGYSVKNHGIGLNYRMSELEGAMVLDQLPRLADLAQRRRKAGDALKELIGDLPNVTTQKAPEDSESSYFLFTFRLDSEARRIAVAQALDDAGWSVGLGYQNLLYKYPVLQDKSFFHSDVWPAELVSGMTYDYRGLYLKNAEFYHDTSICMTLHEGFTEEHVDAIYQIIAKASS